LKLLNLIKTVYNPSKILSFSTIVFYVVLHFFITDLYSQGLNLGQPPTTNYSKQSYKAGNQNRNMTLHQGRLLSANNGGFLVYDGIKWQIHKTPLNTILRSIATAEGDTLYVGGQGELGFFHPDGTGQLIYASLLPSLPENQRNVGEVWDMCLLDGDMYFKTQNNKVQILYKSGAHHNYIHDNRITKLSKVSSEIWYHAIGEGSYRVSQGKAELIQESQAIKDFSVVEFLAHPNGVMLITEKNGLYLYSDKGLNQWVTNVDRLINNAKVNCALLTTENELLLGTQQAGIFKINTQGQLNLLLDRNNGLQNNSVNSLCLTENGGLWSSVGNGIDFIHLGSHKQTFFPDALLEGSIYDIERWKGRLWFASSNGLYHIEEKEYYNPIKDNKFYLTEGSQGQTWGMDIIDGKLLCGHDKGAFMLTEELKPKWIFNENLGVWRFLKVKNDYLALGTYAGVYLMEPNGDEWQNAMAVSGLKESCRVMAYDKHDNLWISHPYKKVYRVKIAEAKKTTTIREYDKTSGFKTDQRNYVYELNGHCYVTNETGVYEYNSEKDAFQVAEAFQQAYPTGHHLRSLVNKNGSVWAISNGGTARINLSPDNSEPLEISFPFVLATEDNYIGGFENLFPLNDSTLLTCSDHGVNKFTIQREDGLPQKPVLSSYLLQDIQDSLLYGGFGLAAGRILKAENNAIRFEYASLTSNIYPQAFYRYFLEGHDEHWSEWTSQTFKEYHRLDPGEYRFNVRAVAPDSSESESATFDFEIKSPWYQSWWAFLLYLLLIAIPVYLLLKIPNNKYQENRNILEAEKAEVQAEKAEVEAEKAEVEAENNRIEEEKKRAEREVIAAQQQMEKLEKEKLESEILFKNKELAMSTMNLLQKNETLEKIRSEIEQVNKKIKDPDAKKEIKKIVSLLRSDDRLEDDWNNFSIHFDQAHHNFLRRIKEQYPKLTPKDQKLCAYLRMNLTTKEIAPLLKISVRGVEISRYRLRKKLKLDKTVNLNDFMMTF